MKKNESGEELEIYIHIPFCARKCDYCDFLSAPAGAVVQRQYTEALIGEINGFTDSDRYRVSTVFFGGGTPSLLPASYITEIMETLRKKFSFADQPEISLECNPGTADMDKLKEYLRAGVNRISFGLQSADDRELKLLGRIHSWETFCRTYEAAREAGFENINVDLMSALPGQTVSGWKETLQKVTALKPEHISAYSLIIEEGTPFYNRYQQDMILREKGEKPVFLPSEDDEREMYRQTELILAKNGMLRYEISNYAVPGYECRHNTGYWTGVSYAGFGLGASSYLKHVRYRNTADLDAYLQKDFSGKESEELTAADEMEEFMFLGLRLMRGVTEAEFRKRFHCEIDEVYKEVLGKNQRRGLLKRENGRIFLTGRGIDVSNQVMAEFLL